MFFHVFMLFWALPGFTATDLQKRRCFERSTRKMAGVGGARVLAGVGLVEEAALHLLFVLRLEQYPGQPDVDSGRAKSCDGVAEPPPYENADSVGDKYRAILRDFVLRFIGHVAVQPLHEN